MAFATLVFQEIVRATGTPCSLSPTLSYLIIVLCTVVVGLTACLESGIQTFTCLRYLQLLRRLDQVILPLCSWHSEES